MASIDAGLGKEIDIEDVTPAQTPDMPSRNVLFVWSPESGADLFSNWAWGASRFSRDVADRRLRDVARAVATRSASPSSAGRATICGRRPRPRPIPALSLHTHKKIGCIANFEIGPADFVVIRVPERCVPEA